MLHYSFAALFLLTLTLFFPACTLAPHYERPVAPIAANYPILNADAAQSPGSPALKNRRSISISDIGWRQFLGDAYLQTLIEIALRNNRDMRIAALNVEQTRAQYQITRANFMPSVNAQGSLSRNRTPADLTFFNRATVATEYQVGAIAAWEIDFFGKLRSLKDAALAEYLSTRFARTAAEIALVSQVADQYLLMCAYVEQLKITQAALSTAQQLYDLVKTQVDVGVGSALDLQAAQGALEQARANHQSQRRLHAQANNALVLLIGEPLPASLPPPLPLHRQVLMDIKAGLPSDLLIRRPDILEAEQNLRAANANIGAARAAFFPNILLTGQFGSASRGLNGLFKAGSAAWSFSPQIMLPIFNGGANTANLDLAHVRKNIAIAQYEKAIQTAFREVADGLAARSTYNDQIAALERRALAEQRRLDLSTLRYHSGIESYLSVLTAQTDLYSAQQQLITTRFARLANLVDLYRTLGGGWKE